MSDERLTRETVTELVRVNLFPHLGMVQKAAIITALNVAPDDAFAAIEPIYREGIAALREGGLDGLRAWLEKQDAPPDLIKFIMRYAEQTQID